MSAAFGPEDLGGLTLIRKTIAARSFDRALACRTHPVKDAVTSSLVAETRRLGYRACSLFTISNTRRRALSAAANCS